MLESFAYTLTFYASVLTLTWCAALLSHR